MRDAADPEREERVRREAVLEKLEEAEHRRIEVKAMAEPGWFAIGREDLALLMAVRSVAAPFARELLRDLAHHAPVTLH